MLFQKDPSNDIRTSIKNFALKNKYSFDIKTRRPFKKLDDKNINHRRSRFNSLFYEDQEKLNCL